MDNPQQSAGRLKLARGLFETVKLEPDSSEYEIRNALSRCYYAFFHLSHVLLGRYRGHKLVSMEIGKVDAALGQFIVRLQALRIEADYGLDVVQKRYGGDLSEYRLRANLVLEQSEPEFDRMTKLAKASLKRRRSR